MSASSTIFSLTSQPLSISTHENPTSLPDMSGKKPHRRFIPKHFIPKKGIQEANGSAMEEAVDATKQIASNS